MDVFSCLCPLHAPRKHRRVTGLLLWMVVALTAWGPLINNITLSSNDYTLPVVQAIASSTLALGLLVVVWVRASWPVRMLCVPLALAAAWTLMDAAGRRLPSILGW